MTARHRTASTEIESRILDAALRILDTQGVAALTVRGIAKEAGIAPMGIYSRFDGKSGIYEALWIEGFDRLAAAIEATPDTGDPLADLAECGERYRGFALANPSHYRLMFMRTDHSFTPSPNAALAAARGLNCLVARVERAQRAGLMPPGPPLDLAQSFWSLVHGFATLELNELMFASEPDAAYSSTVRALLRGLEPADASASI